MTQTTTAQSFSAAYIGFSTDGSVWTDVSGSSGSVVPEGGELQVGNAYTADSDYPITKYGKYGNMNLRVRIVYSETAGEAYALAETAYLAKSALYVRWSPGGGGAGDKGFTSSEGRVMVPPFPGGDVESPDPISPEITISCSSVTPSTIGTAW